MKLRLMTWRGWWQAPAFPDVREVDEALWEVKVAALLTFTSSTLHVIDFHIVNFARDVI